MARELDIFYLKNIKTVALDLTHLDALISLLS